MTLHLGTHTFLWFAWGDTRLPVATRNYMTDPANTVYVSIVSLWEIALKSSLGKLAIGLPLTDFFAKRVWRHAVVATKAARVRPRTT